MNAGMALAMAASLAAASGAEGSGVNVCVAGNGQNPLVLQTALATTRKVFHDIGINLNTRGCQNRDVHTVEVTFAESKGPKDHPGALAYALPYQGSRIVVFHDRVRSIVPSAPSVPYVLGYVLAHEIGHILQGVVRHGEEGILKANWSRDDYSSMARVRVAFSKPDAELIHLGLLARQQRANAGTRATAASK